MIGKQHIIKVDAVEDHTFWFLENHRVQYIYSPEFCWGKWERVCFKIQECFRLESEKRKKTLDKNQHGNGRGCGDYDTLISQPTLAFSFYVSQFIACPNLLSKFKLPFSSFSHTQILIHHITFQTLLLPLLASDFKFDSY